MSSKLVHFGVKGMRWGVRKADKAAHIRDTSSDDARRAGDALTKLKKGGRHTLSNAELQSIVNRMNLEQQFDRLSAAQPTSASRGKKAVQGILATGRTVNDVISFVNSPAGQIIKKALLRT